MLMHNRHVKTFYLIDLDRTLLDTDHASQALIDIVAAEDQAAAERVSSHLQETARFGSQYSLHDSLGTVLGTEWRDRVEARFMAQREINQSLLLPGARQILAFIESDRSTGGILTFGSLPGQTMKIKAVGLDDVPYLVTQQPYKGRLIAEWHRSDGGFLLPAVYGAVLADELILVDDRELSFDGLPEGALGYWVSEEVPSALDAVPLPDRVRPMKNLEAVMNAEVDRVRRTY